jgi:membrane-associated protein
VTRVRRLTLLLAFAHQIEHQRFHGPHADYVGVGVGAAISWLGFSGPGEAALIAAGIAAAHGKVDLASVIVVAWIGATAGGTAGWLLGLRFGRSLMTAQGPLRRLRLRALHHGDRLYERWGPIAVYFAPSWAAGINGMRPRVFLPANAVSGLIWALLVGLGAYAIGPSIADVVGDIGLYGLIGLVALVAVTVLVRGLRARDRAR